MSEMNDKIKFTKMHGAGNDYIYINGFEPLPENLPLLARQISNRHYGVGSDGLVVILPSEHADFRMRMFNADGSESQMCGNASRCIAKYVLDHHMTDKRVITLQTLAGIRTLTVKSDPGSAETEVSVDMGVPELRPSYIPVRDGGAGPVKEKEVTICGEIVKLTAVSMGNPHGVVFVSTITDHMVLELGPRLEVAEIWPEKANIEFAQIVSSNEIKMRVWERGSGETMACGTGACASVVAAVINGLTERHVKVDVRGGTLTVDWDASSGKVFLTGNAVTIADGIFYPLASIMEGEM